MFMTVAFCYNVKKNLPSTDPDSQMDAEFDAPETIAAITRALESGGHKVIQIEADEFAYQKLFRHRKNIDIVFNIAEGVYGDAREAQIPAICDLLQIPYTHSSTLTNAVTLDKALTKKVLLYHQIKTPAFQLFCDPQEPIDSGLRFPFIVKPNAEGSSKGILNSNLVNNKKELCERLTWEFKSFNQPVLVEEFLPGREFTVALLGHPLRVLPIIEQRLDRLPKIYSPFASYEVKWLWEDTLPDPHIAYDCPAKISQKLKAQIETICLKTATVLNCRDVVRIDLRLNGRGTPEILEVNPLPGMIADPQIVSYLHIAARKAGYTFNTMILAILEAACRRYKLK